MDIRKIAGGVLVGTPILVFVLSTVLWWGNGINWGLTGLGVVCALVGAFMLWRTQPEGG